MPLFKEDSYTWVFTKWNPLRFCDLFVIRTGVGVVEFCLASERGAQDRSAQWCYFKNGIKVLK